jgi:hypothetical protein
MADQRTFGFSLSPEQEKQFQMFMAFDPSVRAWQNSYQNRYGEPPNTTNDPTFDYRQAWQAGNKPQPYAGDNGFPHWDSRGKAPDHPTEWMNDFMQRFGADPMMLQPQQVTPEMQQFMRQQLSNVPSGGLF